MSVKRNSRTAECPVDSQGISAAREFRRNIECLKAEMTERQTRLAYGRDTGMINSQVVNCNKIRLF